MSRARRFSQAISEGDGISVIVEIRDVVGASVAEEQGAEALIVRAPIAGIRDATALPLLWHTREPLERVQAAGADACVLVVADADDDGEELERVHSEALELGLDCVLEVRDEEELELALEVDPESFLLVAVENGDADDETRLDRVLDLLPDVPAGKLAIAQAGAVDRDDVVALERAGVDAVVVAAGDVAHLVGAAPPDV